MAAGLLLRAALLYLLRDSALVGDAASYNSAALRIIAGESFPPVRAPGLPLWLAGWQTVFGAGDFSAMVSMLPFYPLLCAAVFPFARRLLGTRSANIALILLSFYPAFVFHSVWPLTQLPTAALLMTSLLLLDRWRLDNPAVCALSGLLLGFCVLIRPNGIIVPAALAAALLLTGRRRGTGAAALLLACSLLPAGGAVLSEYSRSGNLVFINYTNSMNFYLGNNRHTPLYKTWWFGSHGEGERGVPAEFSRELRQIRRLPVERRNEVYKGKALEEISSRPWIFALRTFNRIRCFFAFDTYTTAAAIQRFGVDKITGAAILALDCLFYSVIACGALIFAAGAGVNGPARQSFLLLAAAGLAYTVPFWLSFSHPTYHFPLMPMLAVPAAGIIARARRSPAAVARAVRDGGWNWKLLAALAVFCWIQLEWVYVMLPSWTLSH